MKLDNDTIELINLFEKITNSHVKDCFNNNGIIVFVVKNGEARNAIGIKGRNVNKIEYMIKKKIKIVEYNDDVVKFVRSFLFPIKPSDIKFENDIIEIKADDMKDRGILIGRDRKNLINLKEVVGKYFKVSDIKIV